MTTTQGIDADVGIGISLGCVVFIVAISLYFRVVKKKKGIPDEQFETKRWLLRTEEKKSEREGCCSSLINFCCCPCILALDLFKKFWSVKLTYKAITAIISNAFQLSAFAFAPSIPWTNTSSPSNPVSITQFFGAILLVYDKFLIEFWIVFALAIALIVALFWALFFLGFCMFCNKYGCKCCTKLGWIQKIIDFTLKAIGTVFDLVGFTLVTFFLSALNCSYPSNSPPTLDADTSVVCWQGLHIALVVCALLVIIPMYVGTLVFSAILEDDYPWVDKKKKEDVEGQVPQKPTETKKGFNFATDMRYQFFDVQITFVSAALCTFTSKSPYARLTILMITNLIYLFTSIFVRTSNFEKHNNLRTLSYLFSTWTVICGFVAQSKNDENSYLSFGLWIGGLGLLSIFSIVILLTGKTISGLKSSNSNNSGGGSVAVN